MHPATFGELIDYLEGARASHYLDGPNDVDWVFRNEIEASREERLYVDYVEMDDGADWLTPARFDLATFGGQTPAAVQLVATLTAAGVASPGGLTAVAASWHDFIPAPDTHHSDLAVRIDDSLAALTAMTSTTIDRPSAQFIRNTWPFPLHHADLTRQVVDVTDLRARQERWLAEQAKYYY